MFPAAEATRGRDSARVILIVQAPLRMLAQQREELQRTAERHRDATRARLHTLRIGMRAEPRLRAVDERQRLRSERRRARASRKVVADCATRARSARIPTPRPLRKTASSASTFVVPSQIGSTCVSRSKVGTPVSST